MSREEEKAKLPGTSCLWVLTLRFQGTPESKPDLSKYPECSCFLKSKPLPARWKHSVPETLDSPVGKVTPDTKRVFRKDLRVQTAGDGKQNRCVCVGGCVHTQRKCEGLCTHEIKRIRLGRGSVGKSICCISMKSSLVLVTHRKVQIWLHIPDVCVCMCTYLHECGCVCQCMCVHTYVCIPMRVYMHMYVPACMHVYLSVHVFASVCTCVPLCVHTCMLHTCMCVCTCSCVCISMFWFEHTSLCVCMCVCTCV